MFPCNNSHSATYSTCCLKEKVCFSYIQIPVFNFNIWVLKLNKIIIKKNQPPVYTYFYFVSFLYHSNPRATQPECGRTLSNREENQMEQDAERSVANWWRNRLNEKGVAMKLWEIWLQVKLLEIGFVLGWETCGMLQRLLLFGTERCWRDDRCWFVVEVGARCDGRTR